MSGKFAPAVLHVPLILHSGRVRKAWRQSRFEVVLYVVNSTISSQTSEFQNHELQSRRYAAWRWRAIPRKAGRRSGIKASQTGRRKQLDGATGFQMRRAATTLVAELDDHLSEVACTRFQKVKQCCRRGIQPFHEGFAANELSGFEGRHCLGQKCRSIFEVICNDETLKPNAFCDHLHHIPRAWNRRVVASDAATHCDSAKSAQSINRGFQLGSAGVIKIDLNAFRGTFGRVAM